jgi:hypothetical protein
LHRPWRIIAATGRNIQSFGRKKLARAIRAKGVICACTIVTAPIGAANVRNDSYRSGH